MNARRIRVYPIGNTFSRDIALDQQIALGICDWEAEDEATGRVHVGETAAEARRLLIERGLAA